MTNRVVELAFALGLLSGCREEVPTRFADMPQPTLAPPPPAHAETPAADYRASPPALGALPPFTLPAIEEAKLTNGVRVLIAVRRGLPIVTLRVVVDRGADQDLPSVAAFHGAMIGQGTGSRSSSAIAKSLSWIGARYETTVSFDATTVSLKVLTPAFAAALPIIADLVQNPIFPEKDLDAQRTIWLRTVAVETDSPPSLLRTAIAEALYPAGHAYRQSVRGTADFIQRVTRADLVRFHEYFTPDRATLVVVGDVSRDDVIAKLEGAFGAWKGHPRPERAAPPTPAMSGAPKIVLFDHPGGVQSNIAVACVGARASEDSEAVRLLSKILGARLNRVLRQRYGYTYGAEASFTHWRGPGPFWVMTAVPADVTADALRAILSELERIRGADVTAAELGIAQEEIVRGLPSGFESTGEVADELSRLAIYGRPLDWLATLSARLLATTVGGIRRAAQRYLPEGKGMRVLVVGNAAKVADPLRKLDIGELDVRSAPRFISELGVDSPDTQ